MPVMEQLFSFTTTRFTKQNVYLLALLALVSSFMGVVISNGPTELLYPLLLIVLFVFILTDYFAGFLSVIVLTMVFEQFFTLTPFMFIGAEYKIYPLDFVLLFTAISFFLHFVVKKKKRIILGSLAWPLIIFSVFSLFSFIYGISQGGDALIAFSSFKNYALYAALYVLTINTIQTKEDLLKVVKAFMYSGVILALFIIIGVVTGQGIWAEYNPLSTEGTRLFAASHAFYLGIVVLLSLSLYLQGKHFFGRLTFPLIALQIGGIIISLSRHLWISLSISLFLLFIVSSFSQKKKLAKDLMRYAILGVSVLFVVLWAQGLISGAGNPFGFVQYFSEDILLRFQSIDILESNDPSGLWRLFLWQKAYSLLAASPIIGSGYGLSITFDYLGFPTQSELRSLHNSFLAIAIQMGILGAASFALIQFKIVVDFFRHIRITSGIVRAVFIGSALSLVYFLINANFGVYFELNLLLIFFWIVLGLFEASWRISRKELAEENSKKVAKVS